jgi:hypothetical protein
MRKYEKITRFGFARPMRISSLPLKNESLLIKFSFGNK